MFQSLSVLVWPFPWYLVAIRQQSPADAFFLGFRVRQDAQRRGHDQYADILGRQVALFELFKTIFFYGNARLNDAALVDGSEQMDPDMVSAAFLYLFILAEILAVFEYIEDALDERGNRLDEALASAELLAAQYDR